MLIFLALITVFRQYVTLSEAKMGFFNTFLQKIKNNQDENKLKIRYYLKFCKKSKFVIKFFRALFQSYNLHCGDNLNFYIYKSIF